MFDHLRAQWRTFRATPAGERFQQRHARRSAGRSARGGVRRIVLMAGGFALIVLGIAMIVLPGPGLLAIVIGGGMLAEESLIAARLFDRIDVAIARRVARWRRA